MTKREIYFAWRANGAPALEAFNRAKRGEAPPDRIPPVQVEELITDHWASERVDLSKLLEELNSRGVVMRDYVAQIQQDLFASLGIPPELINSPPPPRVSIE